MPNEEQPLCFAHPNARGLLARICLNFYSILFNFDPKRHVEFPLQFLGMKLQDDIGLHPLATFLSIQSIATTAISILELWENWDRSLEEYFSIVNESFLPYFQKVYRENSPPPNARTVHPHQELLAQFPNDGNGAPEA